MVLGSRSQGDLLGSVGKRIHEQVVQVQAESSLTRHKHTLKEGVQACSRDWEVGERGADRKSVV